MAVTQKLWTTFREKDFLDGMGMHVPKHARRIDYPPPSYFLLRYRNSMHLRQDWEGVDPEEIARYVDKKLKKLGKGWMIP